ncbi:MAG: hypothetical protein L6R30_17000 [Thermoanaerobaculia bacterium]|nr:hypothetical protein [Thermoanaerobaculia bacterium]
MEKRVGLAVLVAGLCLSATLPVEGAAPASTTKSPRDQREVLRTGGSGTLLQQLRESLFTGRRGSSSRFILFDHDPPPPPPPPPCDPELDPECNVRGHNPIGG